MADRHARLPAAAEAARLKRPPGLLKTLWVRIREPLAESSTAKEMLAGALASALRFVYRTNREVEGSVEPEGFLTGTGPVILALWHGQHLLAPCALPEGERVVALFSRSADAELNALVGEKLGFEIVRGSGGRRKSVDKGGARALLALKKALSDGKSVAMIADIPHGKPRDAGLGIVTLARISGRPIVPVALATSRRKVLERSWDKTAINLPFGRRAMVAGTPIAVPSDADDKLLEEKRREVTAGLNAATAKAYRLVSGGA